MFAARPLLEEWRDLRWFSRSACDTSCSGGSSSSRGGGDARIGAEAASSAFCRRALATSSTAAMHSSSSSSASDVAGSGISGGTGNKQQQQQQQDLAALAASSFQRDPRGAAGALSAALDASARRHLLAALSVTAPAADAPGLPRAAMLESDDAANGGSSSIGSDIAAGADAPDAPPAQPAPPTLKQLAWVAVSKGIPFVAFGFSDNAIMITAGEQIDLAFGAKLGLSSMAAAGLGNAVADVVGINISQSIEQRTKRSKFLSSGLTAAQAALPQTQRAKYFGCAFGMCLGCLLGLVPLLFIDTDHREEKVGGGGSGDKRAAAAAAAADGGSSSGGKG